MLKQTKWLTLGFAFVAVVACSSSSNNGAPGAGGDGASAGGESSANNATGTVKDYCTESCTKSHGCDKTVDVQTCSNTCKNDFAAVGPKLRDDFLGSITGCFGSQDCVAVLDNEALGKCTDEAVAELAPSKEGTSFCTDYEDAATKCDNSTFDKADCYDQAKTFNDDALKEAEACLTKACSDIDDCVTATLGAIKDIGSGTTDPGNGTGGTGNGTAGNSGTAGTSSPAGGTSGSGTFTGACTAGDPTQCATGTSINACVNGKYTVVTCKNYLGELGFDGNACAANKCTVGDPNDADCIAGVTAVCTCNPCSTNDQLDYYLACHLDDPAGTNDAFMCAVAAADCNAVNACSP